MQNRRQLVLAPWAGVLCVVGCVLLIGCNLSSDAKLTKVFDGNRNDFDKLLNMSRQDYRIVRIRFDTTALYNDDSWPRKDVGLSEQRWDEYRQLFRKLGIEEGLAHRMISLPRCFCMRNALVLRLIWIAKATSIQKCHCGRLSTISMSWLPACSSSLCLVIGISFATGDSLYRYLRRHCSRRRQFDPLRRTPLE